MAARVGFTSLEEETSIERLPVQGELPAWLCGSLLRTGPAKWEVGERSMNHWFDGLAMLHRFAFAGGDVSYTSRFLRTQAWRAAEERGRISYSEFATDPCRSLFQRVTSLFAPHPTDNANVSLCRLGDRFVALTETPIPVEFDARTLAVAGVPYRPPGMLSTAHPHAERGSGALLNYAVMLGPRSTCRFFRVNAGDAEPEVLASHPVREPAYVHSFGLTPRWFVLVECPFVVNPLRLALGGRPYIENYRWKPELGTRLHLLDRWTGEHLGPFETEPRFLFHHVNAYEDGPRVVVDVCAFPDAGVVEDLYMQHLRAGKPVARSYLERFTIDPTAGTVVVERLIEEPIDLPRINDAQAELSYRYAWGVGNRSGWLDAIVKVDVAERVSRVWLEEQCFAGEPVFVAAPGASAEDDGVVLSVVLGPDGRSFLLVLDAATLTELARAEVPHHIPFGFHGMFAA
jgi:beta,beta-carotene 9',10'-dioxygenase